MKKRYSERLDVFGLEEAFQGESFLTTLRHFSQPQRKSKTLFSLRLGQIGLKFSISFGNLLPKEPHSGVVHGRGW